MSVELGGKGNPRIMRHFQHVWHNPFYATARYTVTLWSYTLEVPTRAEAAQLLHAISHVTGGELNGS